MILRNTHRLWDRLGKKTEIQKFTHSTNVYFLSIYYEPGTMQMPEKKYWKAHNLKVTQHCKLSNISSFFFNGLKSSELIFILWHFIFLELQLLIIA